MQVKITLDDKKEITMPVEEWNSIGGEDGFCKQHKIYKYQIIGIEYILNQTNQNERITND